MEVFFFFFTKNEKQKLGEKYKNSEPDMKFVIEHQSIDLSSEVKN